MKLASVDNSYSLALASCDGLRRNKVDLRVDTKHCLYRNSEVSLLLLHILYLIRELIGIHLYADVKGIGVVYTVDLNEVVR